MGIRVNVSSDNLVKASYDAPTTGALVWQNFTAGSSVAALKAAHSLAVDAELIANTSNLARDFIGFVIPLDTLHEVSGKLSSAAAISAIPIAMENTRKAYSSVVKLVSSPSRSNVRGFVISAVKAAKETCEVASGFGLAKAKLPKSVLSIVADVDGIWNAATQKASLDSEKPVKPHIEKHQAAYTAQVNAELTKNVTALVLHVVGFATGFFAIVISPYWSASLGMIYLVAGVVSFVRKGQADAIEQSFNCNAINELQKAQSEKAE